jgi:hypothetical protein
LRLLSGFTSTTGRLSIRVRKLKKEKYDQKIELSEEMNENEEFYEIEKKRAERAYDHLKNEWLMRRNEYKKCNDIEIHIIDEENLSNVQLEPSLTPQNILFPDNLSVTPIKETSKREKSYSHIFPYDQEPILKPVLKFSSKTLKESIKKRLIAAFRPVNSPILTFTWEEDQTITLTSDCPPVFKDLNIRMNKIDVLNLNLLNIASH